MSDKKGILNLLNTMLKVGTPPPRKQVTGITNAGGQELPQFAEYDPAEVEMITVQQEDGRFSTYPPRRILGQLGRIRRQGMAPQNSPPLPTHPHRLLQLRIRLRPACLRRQRNIRNQKI
jgi:hypothetical protein